MAFWNWDPSNDRDFTGLQVLAKSQNPARHAVDTKFAMQEEVSSN
jgi:iron complex outermembrane receptor protein